MQGVRIQARTSKGRKFDSRAEEGILIECFRGDAFKILTDYETRVIESKNVKFDDGIHSIVPNGSDQEIDFDVSDPSILIDDLIINRDGSI